MHFLPCRCSGIRLSSIYIYPTGFFAFLSVIQCFWTAYYSRIGRFWGLWNWLIFGRAVSCNWTESQKIYTYIACLIILYAIALGQIAFKNHLSSARRSVSEVDGRIITLELLKKIPAFIQFFARGSLSKLSEKYDFPWGRLDIKKILEKKVILK